MGNEQQNGVQNRQDTHVANVDGLYQRLLGLVRHGPPYPKAHVGIPGEYLNLNPLPWGHKKVYAAPDQHLLDMYQIFNNPVDRCRDYLVDHAPSSEDFFVLRSIVDRNCRSRFVDLKHSTGQIDQNLLLAALEDLVIKFVLDEKLDFIEQDSRHELTFLVRVFVGFHGQNATIAGLARSLMSIARHRYSGDSEDHAIGAAVGEALFHHLTWSSKRTSLVSEDEHYLALINMIIECRVKPIGTCLSSAHALELLCQGYHPKTRERLMQFVCQSLGIFSEQDIYATIAIVVRVAACAPQSHREALGKFIEKISELCMSPDHAVGNYPSKGTSALKAFFEVASEIRHALLYQKACYLTWRGASDACDLPPRRSSFDIIVCPLVRRRDLAFASEKFVQHWYHPLENACSFRSRIGCGMAHLGNISTQGIFSDFSEGNLIDNGILADPFVVDVSFDRVLSQYLGIPLNLMPFAFLMVTLCGAIDLKRNRTSPLSLLTKDIMKRLEVFLTPRNWSMRRLSHGYGGSPHRRRTSGPIYLILTWCEIASNDLDDDDYL